MSVEWQRSKGVRTDHMKRRALIVRRWALYCRRRASDTESPDDPAEVDVAWERLAAAPDEQPEGADVRSLLNEPGTEG